MVDRVFWLILIVAIIFGLYYLLRMVTIKKNGCVQSTSLVVKIPLIIECINILGVGIGIISFNLPLSLFKVVKEAVLLLYGYYIFFAFPVSIGSIAISVVDWKKKVTTSKWLRGVVWVNIISIVLAFGYVVFFGAHIT